MGRRHGYADTDYNPWEPTETLPNSENRIQVYRSRAAARQSVCRKEDRQEDDRRGVYARPNGSNGKPVPLPRLEEEQPAIARTEVRGLKIAAIIRIYRRRRGWTAKQLAQHCGLSVRCIEYYEAGQRQPGYAALRALAAAFALSISEFFPSN